MGSKYPVNYAVPNSSNASSVSEGFKVETDLELVTLKIIELGVELRRGRLIKEVLLHLRGALQTVHAFSFEFVLRALMGEAESKFSAKTAECLEQRLASLDLDDEFCAGAGTGGVASAESKEEKVDTEVTPWLRFYWEVLRMILEISRNNSRLELIYHDAALESFKFCRQFSRKNEFRRLSEMIRYHLALSVKYPGQLNAVPLATSTGSHQLALELRFNQLTLACDMELWQEAFKTVEDIYGLQLLARKSVRQLTAPEYFDKLARIFAKSDNFLFLAATLLRQSKLEGEQIKVLLMATLAVPVVSESSSVKDGSQASERLAQIIGLSSVPSRAALLKVIEQRGLLQNIPSEFVDLFESMKSVELNVSKGVAALQKCCQISALKPFIRGCYENLLTLQVGQILKTRDSISLKELKEISCFDSVRLTLIPKFNLEMFLLSRANFKGIKINHMSGEILIDRSMLLANPEAFTGIDKSMTWCHLQSEMRKLTNFNEQVVPFKGSLKALLEKEHESNLERRNLIEKRKEQLESAAADKERQEARERALKQQQEAEIERFRQAEEIARRDKERLEKDRAEIRKLEAEKRLAEQEKMKEAAGARLNREKIAAAATRLDYLERALRAEEIPLLENDYVKQKDCDRSAYDSRCKMILEVAGAKHARDLEMKHKFTQSSQFESDYRNFFARSRENRQKEFELKILESEKDLEIEKEKRRVRILNELENRRRIEAEREAARAPLKESTISSPASGSNVYVSPALKASSWRRESPSTPVASESTSSATASIPATPTSTSEEPKKDVFVPRHKRTTLQ